MGRIIFLILLFCGIAHADYNDYMQEREEIWQKEAKEIYERIVERLESNERLDEWKTLKARE